MSAVFETDLLAGARNLLVNCGEAKAGDKVLVVHEDPALGWYDLAAPQAVAAVAAQIGAAAELIKVGDPINSMPTDVAAAIDASDVTVYFARLGDHGRFGASRERGVSVVSYARTATALASEYGTRPHAGMAAIKKQVDDLLYNAAEITVTCPLGTSLHGAPLRQAEEGPADVSVRRFPLCVPAPVSAAKFEGTVALNGYLAPTGNRTYHPACQHIEGIVTVEICAGRIQQFRGEQAAIDAIQQHYAHVAGLFDLDAGIVDSWHAGIHAGCAFDQPEEADPDLWANTLFGNPNYVHFHTCGAPTPGEISWMVESPTIAADGKPIWLNGSLCIQ